MGRLGKTPKQQMYLASGAYLFATILSVIEMTYGANVIIHCTCITIAGLTSIWLIVIALDIK